MISFAALLAIGQTGLPYEQKAPVAILSVEGSTSTPQFGVQEVRVGATGTYKNPFDSDEVSLDAEVSAPSGATYRVPGFLYRPYARVLNGGQEKITPKGSPIWMVRICPTEVGSYKVKFIFKDKNGSAEKPFQFSSSKSSESGFVRASEREHHYFETDDGKSFFPVGANICWAGPRGTYDYDDWLLQFGKNGGNYLRLWLAPQWVTLSLEKAGKKEDGLGFGQIDLSGAWKLDYVLNVARENHMRAMLCIDSYNELRKTDAYPQWDNSSWNKDNGGPLSVWTEFWTNKTMDHVYRNKLRYLIARYSAYTNVFAWELWNEVDITSNFDKEVARPWHQRMASEIKKLDPYHHLVTTSFSDSMGDRSIDLLPSIDYVQTHLYSPTLVDGIAMQSSRKGEWDRPHVIGEVGADSGGPRESDDPLGIQVHDALWISVVSGTAGGAMSWWWDNLIAPKNLYGLYGIFSNYVKGVDFVNEHFRSVDGTVKVADPSAPAIRGDLVLDAGPASWTPDPANQPANISIEGEKMHGQMPSTLLHGVRNHPTLHNPLTILLKESHDTTLKVQVSEVSTYGGARLVVSMDGAALVDKTFDTGENNQTPQTAHKFDGPYTITIPAGAHRIVVDNQGNDWLRVGYRFVDLLSQRGVARNWAMVGDKTGLVWVQRAGRSWKAVVEEKVTLPEIPETILTVPTLAAGTYRVEIWDTWKLGIIKTTSCQVALDGKAKIALPKFSTDLAVKLIKK